MDKAEEHTFSFVLNRFLERCRERRLAPATVKMYEFFAERYLRPKLGHHHVSQVGLRDFEELFAEMDEQGLKPSTIQKCRVTASGALRVAQRAGLVEANVVRLAEGPKLRADVPTVPSVEDVRRFFSIAAQRDPDIHDLAQVLAATGVRPGEGCGLRTEDLDGFSLKILRTIDCSDGHARVRQTKTGRARRITVDEFTANIIRSRPGPYVFSGTTPWRPDLVAKKFLRLSRAAGVEVKPISLRHFHATQLLASGKLNIKQVAGRLGHANPGETLRVYAHFIPSLDIVAAQVIDDVLRGGEGSREPQAAAS